MGSAQWGLKESERENRDRQRKAVAKRSAGRAKTNSEQIEAGAKEGQKGKNMGKKGEQGAIGKTARQRQGKEEKDAGRRRSP